jgi:hypothetical protein
MGSGVGAAAVDAKFSFSVLMSNSVVGDAGSGTNDAVAMPLPARPVVKSGLFRIWLLNPLTFEPLATVNGNATVNGPDTRIGSTAFPAAAKLPSKNTLPKLCPPTIAVPFPKSGPLQEIPTPVPVAEPAHGKHSVCIVPVAVPVISKPDPMRSNVAGVLPAEADGTFTFPVEIVISSAELVAAAHKNNPAVSNPTIARLEQTACPCYH